ncbi:uncharacterized protein LOC144563696 [Carex rostrata]
MSPLLLIFLIFLLGPTSCSTRHNNNINIYSSTLIQFSSLAWDPIAKHFVAGSTLGPAVYAIPEAGIVKCLFSEPFFNSSGVSATVVAVDHIRRRLIVGFSNRSSVAAYDLESYRRIVAVSLPELDDGLGGVTMDLESGEVFVSSAHRGVVLKVGVEGDRWKVIAEFKIPNNQGLGGLVHTSQGYIITVQPTTKKIFKVDSVKRTVEEILSGDSGNYRLAPAPHAITLRTNLSAVVATNHALASIKSDNTWEQAYTTDIIKHKHEKTVVALAMRGGKTFALMKSQESYWIEEVFWGMSFLVKLTLWILLFVSLLWFLVKLTLMWKWNGKDKYPITPYGHWAWPPIEWPAICCWFQKK